MILRTPLVLVRTMTARLLSPLDPPDGLQRRAVLAPGLATSSTSELDRTRDATGRRALP
jgi:hypothetical protein